MKQILSTLGIKKMDQLNQGKPKEPKFLKLLEKITKMK